MERDAFVAILEPLVLSMRAEMDKPTWSAYFQALKDVPAPLFEAAVATIGREPREFFPKAGEFRAVCERSRRRQLADHPWAPCVECEDFPGFRKVLVDGVGQETREKCPCKAAYRERLDVLGLLEPIASLPGEVGIEVEPVLLRRDQLPAPVQAQLKAIEAQKGMS